MPIDHEPAESPGSSQDDQDVPFATEWDLRGSEPLTGTPIIDADLRRQEEDVRRELSELGLELESVIVE